jgi:hypothetical protein
MYFYDDHTAPPGANLKLEGDKWVWDKTEYPPMILEVPASRTVIIRYAPGERMAVLPGAPGWLLGSHEHITALTSTPSKGNAPSARAANRYLFRPACCQLVQKGVSN